MLSWSDSRLFNKRRIVVQHNWEQIEKNSCGRNKNEHLLVNAHLCGRGNISSLTLYLPCRRFLQLSYILRRRLSMYAQRRRSGFCICDYFFLLHSNVLRAEPIDLWQNWCSQFMIPFDSFESMTKGLLTVNEIGFCGSPWGCLLCGEDQDGFNLHECY